MAEDRTPGKTERLGEDAQIKLLSKICERYENGVGAFEENRRMFSEDLRFAFDSEGMGQWAPETLAMRKGRPSYTFNHVIGPINLIIADQRQSRPAAKFRPATDDASEEVAEVFAGLWRCTERDSRADAHYDQQYKYAVSGGFGELRLLPEYAADDSFDQILKISGVANPLTVIRDPECMDPCGGDAMWCIVADRISRDKYKELYPDAGEGNSFTMSRDSFGWFTDKEIRVAEYWERVCEEEEIALLEDGTVIPYTAVEKKLDKQHRKEGKERNNKIVDTRVVLKWKVRWVKVDGSQVLEGPITYDWKRIPIIRIPGRYINIEGRQKFQSAIRHSKDGQRLVNFLGSDVVERSSLIPKTPYLVTGKMISGYEDIWANANVVPRPYLPYNVDKDAPGERPERQEPVDLPQGSLALLDMAAKMVQISTGFFDPALGNAEDMNRVSGKALVQHTRRSDLGSYEFIDGFQKALQLLAECFLDMAPTIYDAERVVQILGQDETQKLVLVNGQGPQGIINNLKAGSYHVTVTLGPSYQTQRQEALATLVDLVQTLPALGQVAPDLIAKNIDTPEAPEIVQRVRTQLVKAGLVQPTPQEQRSMPPPAPPNPLMVAELQEKQANAAKAQAQATYEQNKLRLGPIETHKMVNEAAGRHLENLKLAKEIDQPGEAQSAEAQASQ